MERRRMTNVAIVQPDNVNKAKTIIEGVTVSSGRERVNCIITISYFHSDRHVFHQR